MQPQDYTIKPPGCIRRCIRRSMPIIAVPADLAESATELVKAVNHLGP
jgi:hypothetical protein